MGYIGSIKSGGKVTTENLTAENIKTGVTISVKQGNKVIASADGGYYGDAWPLTIRPASNGNIHMNFRGEYDVTPGFPFTANNYQNGGNGWWLSNSRSQTMTCLYSGYVSISGFAKNTTVGGTAGFSGKFNDGSVTTKWVEAGQTITISNLDGGASNLCIVFYK